MTVAIDFCWNKSIESGTKTYNINFCKYLSEKKINKIYIFITKNYFRD